MTGAAGLGGAETSVGVLAKESLLSSGPEDARMDVSASPSGRGVSGGFASVDMSDRASDGVSKPDDEVELGNAECRWRCGVEVPADEPEAARIEDMDDIRLEDLEAETESR